MTRSSRRRLIALAAFSVLLATLAPPLLSDPQDTARLRYEALDELVGQSCTHDRDCPSPLRCYEDACAKPPAIEGSEAETTPMVLFYGDAGESLFHLEIADDPEERQRGLMDRPSMLDNWGMLFVYPEEQPLSFWMYHTYIPLDMIFLDGEGTVVGVVANAEPLTTTSRAVPGNSRFVIELNAGQAEAHGIHAGVRCEFLDMPPGTL